MTYDLTFQNKIWCMFSFQKRERNLHMYNVKTLEVYNVKTLEVFVYQIFTEGDMLIIPNIELM